MSNNRLTNIIEFSKQEFEKTVRDGLFAEIY